MVYHEDLENRERCGVVAHERPAFQDLNGKNKFMLTILQATFLDSDLILKLKLW